MKRVKRIVKKCDSREGSAEDTTDSDEKQMQLNLKKRKWNKPTSVFTAPSNPSDSANAPIQTKTKRKGKKPNVPKPVDESSQNTAAGSEDKLAPTRQNRKVRKALVTPAPMEEDSGELDSDIKSVTSSISNREIKKSIKMVKDSDSSGFVKPTQTKKKGKGVKAAKKLIDDPSDDLDSDRTSVTSITSNGKGFVKPTQTKKKGKGVKAAKKPIEEPSDDIDSDIASVSSKISNGKGKKSIKMEPVKDSDSSDSGITSVTSKMSNGEGKKSIKMEPVKDSDSSGFVKPTQTKKKGKGVKAAKKLIEEPSADIDSDRSSVTSITSNGKGFVKPTPTKKKGKGVKAAKEPIEKFIILFSNLDSDRTSVSSKISNTKDSDITSVASKISKREIKKSIKMVKDSDSSGFVKPTQIKKTGKGVKAAKKPIEEPSDDLDSDRTSVTSITSNGKGFVKPTQTKKTGKGVKVAKKPIEEPSDDLDADEKTSVTSKIANRKRKKSNKTEPVENSDSSDSDEKTSVTSKIANRKGKKSNKTEPVENSDSSDFDRTSVTSKIANRKGKKSNNTEPVKNSNSSDSDEKKSVTSKTANRKRKKSNKTEPVENSDSSDFDEKTSVTSKIASQKGKKSNKTEPVENSDSSESESESEYEAKNYPTRRDPSFDQFLKSQDNNEFMRFIDYKDLIDDSSDEDIDEDSAAADSGLASNGDDNGNYNFGFEHVHVPVDLHGNSDESDFEDYKTVPIKGRVTLKMVKQWEGEFQKEGNIKLSTLTHVVKLFNGAVLRATSEDGTTEGEYKVAGSSVFNAILNMCVVNLPKAIGKYLRIEESGKHPRKCKHFVKIKGILVQYLTDVLKLLSAVTSNEIIIVLLKHLHQMYKYVGCFIGLAKLAIKKMLTLWSSSGDDTVRVLAFMCILCITRDQENDLLEIVLKAMFLKFVKNCKFVSPTTWPGINFMRRCLVEMYSLDVNASYPHVFLYVRQLGIHLRNAIVVPKLENRQAVYNWQFLNSLQFWSEVVSRNVKNERMKSIVHPLVMIISNTIKLGPTPQYYPVRFFLVEMLINMANETGAFIPILGFLVDVVIKWDINKKPKKASMKPLDFSCIIRLSKSQMNESGFKDAVVNRLYALLLEFTASISYTMVFPEMCTILILYLRNLAAKCTTGNSKKLKQLYDKIVENNEHMNKKRLAFDGQLCSAVEIQAWEQKIKAEGTPLMTYYENWSKIDRIQKRKNITKNDELAVVMPLIKRPKISDNKENLAKPNNSNPVKLFPSDTEDETDFFETTFAENKAPPKEKKTKKKDMSKKNKKKEDSQVENTDTAANKDTVDNKNTVDNKDTVDNTDNADAGDIVQDFNGW